MRRVALLLAITGAVAGLAVTTGASAGETVDTLPVFITDRSTTAEYMVVFGSDRAGAGPEARLGVFRAPPRPGDAIPDSAGARWQPVPRLTPERERSRLLLSEAAVTIYAFPTKEGGACYVVVPRGEGGCLPSLIDGAFPQVRPWRDVWGLVDDGAVRVDVRLGAGWRRAHLGRNAFYLPLPPNVAAPTQILVHERTGPDHRYLVERCRIGRITPLTGASPLGPGPCG